MRPPSITTTSSASETVERRWALTKVVRPATASARPALIAGAVVADERDLRAQRDEVDRAHVGAVDRDRALARVVEAGDQRYETGLARARGADQGHGAPCLDRQVDPGESGGGAVVAQAHAAHL